VFCVFLFIFLRVAVSASCQEPCCPAHIMFFHCVTVCVTLLCYAPDVEQIKMMKMMAPRRIEHATSSLSGSERDARNASTSRHLCPYTRCTFRAKLPTILSLSVMTANNSAK